MKKYDGKTMTNSSRFTGYTDKLNESDREQLYKRVDRFIKENREYCDSGNYQHLCNIFTFMALYDLLIEKGMSKEEVIDKVSETMYAYMKTQKEKFEKLARYPIFWTLIKKIVPVGFKRGSGYGWKYTWYKDEDKDLFRFECNECIYQKIFAKYGHSEFGPIFCKNDILVYGSLSSIDFKRTGTLCQGYEKCDFSFRRYPKGQPFERSKSQ